MNAPPALTDRMVTEVHGPAVQVRVDDLSPRGSSGNQKRCSKTQRRTRVTQWNIIASRDDSSLRDGNYEALSHKLAFDKDLNRTICVDVRYVLWCIEKLGGAKNIVDELKLVSK